jgi:methylmalonyl-CoA/ethylmalonyl-CoA epimerase
MKSTFTFHHVGIAVSALESAAAFYRQTLGFSMVSGPFEDPIQKVAVCFLGTPGRETGPVELISPLDTASPVNGYLAKGIGAYHVCYEVDDLEDALSHLQSAGSLQLTEPAPAVAFGGRRILWCFAPTKHLIELLERQTPDQQ